MSSVAFSEETARDTMEKSRREVMYCEKEIQSIKDSLKSLNPSAGDETDEDSLNSLMVAVDKVKLNAEDPINDIGSPRSFKVHLSSPTEVRTITSLHDPLHPTAEGSFALFKSVEISNAILTIEAFSSEDISEESKLGVSAAHDLLPLCKDVNSSTGWDTKKSLTIEVAIVSEKGDLVAADLCTSEENFESKSSDSDDKVVKGGDSEPPEIEGVEGDKTFETSKGKSSAVTETDGGDYGAENTEGNSKPVESMNASGEDKTENDDDQFESVKDEVEVVATEERKQGQDMSDVPGEESKVQVIVCDVTEASGEESKVQIPVCVLSVHLEYTPSLSEKRDALYNKLNEVSKRKAAAIEALRKSAAAVNRARAEQGISSDNVEKNTAVKAGFLNKPKASGSGEKHTPPPFWKRVYEKTLGPQSMLWVMGPLAKNYVIFLAVSVFFHCKGDLLALPPPV